MHLFGKGNLLTYCIYKHTTDMFSPKIHPSKLGRTSYVGKDFLHWHRSMKTLCCNVKIFLVPFSCSVPLPHFSQF